MITDDINRVCFWMDTP